MQIGNPEEVTDIRENAKEVADKWVHPLSGGKEEINGLIYGLVQSGKTGVLTVTGAIGADEGYRTIIILTSDNDPLYEQTLGRAQEAFRGWTSSARKTSRTPMLSCGVSKAGPVLLSRPRTRGF